MSQGSAAHPTKAVTRWGHTPVPVRRALVRTRRWSHLSRRARPNVTVDVVGPVATIVFDDGKVNAISRQAARVLTAARERVATDESITAVVLAGREGQFSAGFDLDTLLIGGPDREELFRSGWDALMRFYTLPIPLVVACTGNAVAAGAVLLLAGDLRLGAAGEFAIGFNEAAIGLPLPGMLLKLAHDCLTESSYDEATFGARLYSPDAALAAGFLHRVVPAPDVLSAARTAAERMAHESSRTDKARLVAERAEFIQRQLPADLELMTGLG